MKNKGGLMTLADAASALYNANERMRSHMREQKRKANEFKKIMEMWEQKNKAENFLKSMK